MIRRMLEAVVYTGLTFCVLSGLLHISETYKTERHAAEIQMRVMELVYKMPKPGTIKKLGDLGPCP